MKLDKIDRKILAVLHKDGRVPNTTLAKEFNVSVSTVRNRIKRMQENDIVRIIGYSDPVKLGYPIPIYAFLKVESQYVETVAEQLTVMKETHSVIALAGPYEIGIKSSFKSIKSHNKFLYKSVAKLKGVKHIETSLFLKIYKTELSVEIPGRLQSEKWI